MIAQIGGNRDEDPGTDDGPALVLTGAGGRGDQGPTPEKKSSWTGEKAAPVSPRDLISNEARTKAKKWLDAMTAVGLLYKFRVMPVAGVGPQQSEPLWPIAGVGTLPVWHDGLPTKEEIVVFTMREFPMPDYLKIKEWDGYPVSYVEAGHK